MLASRVIILQLTESFYRREDLGLEKRLLAKLPGFLNWALDGLHRLRQRGHFKLPASSEEAMAEMEALASTASAFIRDKRELAPGVSVPVDRLFTECKLLCEDAGRRKPGTKQLFGRNLKTALPRVRLTQMRDQKGKQHRQYEGIGLK